MPYEDILHLSRPVSGRHAPMPLSDRAAQFSPFAALTGYEAVIAETGRLTQPQIELDESSVEVINSQLNCLLARLPQKPVATVVWFQPDPRKEGGSYLHKTGTVKKLDAIGQYLEFTDGTCIAFSQLLSVQLSTP